MHDKVTDGDKIKARGLVEKISPVPGEMRCVYKCTECGGLFGHRFIPYGIGRGLLVNMCLCQMVGHVRSLKVLECTP